jgi:spermidine synthase
LSRPEIQGNFIVPHFKITKDLCHEKSDFHDIRIVEAENLGRVLVLDSVIQATSVDGFFFHEMFVHVPMLSLERPENILMVGLGTGGILQEILKHPSVKKVYAVDIDQKVVELCEKFMPELNDAGAVFRNPKVEVIYADAAEIIKNWQGPKLDAIIINSTDPGEVSNPLFTSEFYQHCKEALADQGVMVAQTGAPTESKQTVRDVSRLLKPIFPLKGCFVVSVPSFMCGYFTITWASKKNDLRRIEYATLKERYAKNPFKTYIYNTGLHKAAFEMPSWYHHLVADSKEG